LQNGLQSTNNSGQYNTNNIRFLSKNCPIVATDLFRRCESEEQLLDAPGDIGRKIDKQEIWNDFLGNQYYYFSKIKICDTAQ
jgi:hypothetical protein